VVTNGLSGAAPEWPTLLGRTLEDVGRVIQLDIQLLEAKFSHALNATVDRAIAHVLVLYISVLGGSCLLASLIFLIHEWLPWWICFVTVGTVVVTFSLVMHLRMKGSLNLAESKRT
jgi:hypothetical protein